MHVIIDCWYRHHQRTERKTFLEKHKEEKRQRFSLVPDKPKIEEAKVYETLFKRNSTAVVISVVPGFDQAPETSRMESLVEPNLPAKLDSLYDRKNYCLSENDLFELSNKTFEHLKVTQEEADFLEKSTRAQSKSTVWYDHRIGRITASHFYEVLKHKWAWTQAQG